MMRHATALAVCCALTLSAWIASPAIIDAAAWLARGRHEAGADRARVQAPADAARRERAYRANNIGVARLEQFDYKGAEASFREALTIDPALGVARLNLAIAIFYAGRPGDALEQARAAASELQNTPQAHYVHGLTARADDKLEEAVAAFERVLKLDATDAGAKIQLGQIHLQERRYPDAIRVFGEALAAEPFNVTAAYSVALALTRGGQAEAGRAAMQRFESLRDAPYGVTYSQNYLGQGKYAEAIASTGAEPELVNPATPKVTFTERAVTAAREPAAPQAQPPGQVTLFDADGDGDLDIAASAPAGLRLLRNGGNGQFTDGSASSGLGSRAARGAVAGDYDNDTRTDLLIVGPAGLRLLHQRADAGFEDVTKAAGLEGVTASFTSAAFADVDHDGDLDIAAAGETVVLLRNNGSGTFEDVTAAAGLTAKTGGGASIAASDLDNGRDIDLLIAAPGRGVVYFRNLRDGSFRDSSAESGLPTGPRYTALAVADVNKDGYVDLFLAGREGPGTFALSDGQRRFRSAAAPDGTRGALAGQFADYDNDGLLDLVTLMPREVRIFRNLGAGGWAAATGPRMQSEPADVAWQSLALGDVDADGDADVLVLESTGRVRLFGNDGGNTNASLRVRLVSRVSNRAAVGARVEVRAGSLRQMLEASSSVPAVAPADLLFGLGPRPGPDAARVLWPSGILQAETSFDAGPAASAAATGRSVVVNELDRKPSSCPYLFTWNGTQFEFVTDFLGGGEMGAWLAPSTWNQPDPDEYVRITSRQLQPRAGRYELRLTNELEEALFFDRVQLLAVDHAAGELVFPNEGLRSAPRPPFALTAVGDVRPPRSARDEHGHDVLPRLSSLDRKYLDDFAVDRIRGYAAPHELVLDLGEGAERPVLLLTGWTDYAFSNDNVAASQAGMAMHPPSLQVRDSGGTWRTVMAEIGFPVGRPQTIVVKLDGVFLSPSREVRILTNMRIYWDQVLVGAERPAAGLTVRRIDPASAVLRERGISAEVTPDGREPYLYDYQRVSAEHPWKVLVGKYTAVGDVRPLLRGTDDLFVIAKPGDEISVSFPALAATGDGRDRTFLLYAHGYSKEMNPRSASPDSVEPLPFRAMSGYPYGSNERYPATPRHRAYQDRYNTRVVSRPIPSIDTLLDGGTR